MGRVRAARPHTSSKSCGSDNKNALSPETWHRRHVFKTQTASRERALGAKSARLAAISARGAKTRRLQSYQTRSQELAFY